MPAEWEKMLPKELREYIEAERRLAHAAGYAEAKSELAGAAYLAPHGATPTPTRLETPEKPPRSIPNPKLSRDEAIPMARGLAAMHAEQVFRDIAPRAATGKEARLIVKKTVGLDLPSTTFYRAIKALAERGAIEQVGNTSAWRYVDRHEGESGSSNDELETPDSGSLASAPKGNGAVALRP
jgi:hypothetical protein